MGRLWSMLQQTFLAMAGPGSALRSSSPFNQQTSVLAKWGTERNVFSSEPSAQIVAMSNANMRLERKNRSLSLPFGLSFHIGEAGQVKLHREDQTREGLCKEL